MKIGSVQSPQRPLVEVDDGADQQSRDGVTRCWRGRCTFSLVAALCLAPLLAAAGEDKVETGATQQSPGPGTSVASPSRETPPAPAPKDGNGGAKPETPVSGGIMDALDAKQKLGVGDTIVFRVLEDQEDPKPLSVTDAGELSVPELGLVKAAGKTCKQLAFEIKSKLEQTTYYHATVVIGLQLLNKTISGRRVYLAGQVRITGPQEIPAGETWTVSKAIMRAGGFTDYADKKHVRLLRAGAKGEPGKTSILNVSEIWEKGRTEKDLSVEPEDVIYVAERAVNF